MTGFDLSNTYSFSNFMKEFLQSLKMLGSGFVFKCRNLLYLL